MIQHPVQHCDAIAEIGLKQRHERAAVPSGKRSGAEAAALVLSDSIFVEPGAILLFVEVVRRGQLCEEPAAIGCEGTTSEDLLEGRCKPRSRMLANAPQNCLALHAKIWPQQREQLDDDLVFDFRRNFRMLPPTAARVADLGKQLSIALDELTFLLDLLWRPSCTRGSGCRARFFETPIRGRARRSEAFAEPHAQTR